MGIPAPFFKGLTGMQEAEGEILGEQVDIQPVNADIHHKRRWLIYWRCW